MKRLTVLPREKLNKVWVEVEPERLECVPELGGLNCSRAVCVEPLEHFLPVGDVSVESAVALKVHLAVLPELAKEHLDRLVRERRPVSARDDPSGGGQLARLESSAGDE